MNDNATVCIAAPVLPWLTDELSARFRVVEPGEADGDVRILITSAGSSADRDLIDRFPALRLIAVFGVGYDGVDIDHARSHDIAVTNTPDVLTDDVADLAVGLVLASFRRVAANDRFVREGKWGKAPNPPLARKVTGARFGILGLGRIGAAIATRLEGFSPHIAYHSRNPVEGSGYRYVPSAVELARESDVLIVATPGGADTSHLVDAEVLDALGAKGVLVNIARGTVVDEDALVAALTERRIAGAALDVFANEPNVPEALFEMENVVLQPHQASATVETRRAMAELVLANVEAFVAGRELPTAV